jgi:hypothetical protein
MKKMKREIVNFIDDSKEDLCYFVHPGDLITGSDSRFRLIENKIIRRVKRKDLGIFDSLKEFGLRRRVVVKRIEDSKYFSFKYNEYENNESYKTKMKEVFPKESLEYI